MVYKPNLVYLAVYGSLKESEINHNLWLSKSEYIGTTKTRKKFVLHSDGLRALARKPQKGEVSHCLSVELYQIPEGTLKGLDISMKNTRRFLREQVRIQKCGGQRNAWIYIYHGLIDEESVFPHGNWSTTEHDRLTYDMKSGKTGSKKNTGQQLTIFDPSIGENVPLH